MTKVCKTFMRRFDPDPRLQSFLINCLIQTVYSSSLLFFESLWESRGFARRKRCVEVAANGVCSGSRTDDCLAAAPVSEPTWGLRFARNSECGNGLKFSYP